MDHDTTPVPAPVPLTDDAGPPPVRGPGADAPATPSDAVRRVAAPLKEDHAHCDVRSRPDRLHDGASDRGAAAGNVGCGGDRGDQGPRTHALHHVALFQSTIDQLVLLAAFLPVLAGQAGNTGAQAMAVTLRGITIGEIRRASQRVRKEALLGILNGIPVGVSAALVMYLYATMQGEPVSLMLGLVVFIAMMLSCVLSGMIGAGVPLLLRRLGADPATASSILLSTATDVLSMGLLLWLTAWLVL